MKELLKGFIGKNRNRAINGIAVKILLLLIIFILTQTLSFADIRYVSKTGSSTPPYTSRETASDSIQKAINISKFGDTIYVANGVYKERVFMIRGLSLIGGGMDSCIIDTREFEYFSGIHSVRVEDSYLFMGFNIFTNSQNRGLGIHIRESSGIIISAVIKYNKIQKAVVGINFSSFSRL